MSSPRGQRVEANCKIIWGDDSDYDLEIETDDHSEYAWLVRKDFGTSFGPPLTMTNYYPSVEAAWTELDRMLSLLAKQVQRGTPMTKQESLEIFGGSRGEHRNILSKFMDYKEKIGGTKST